MILHPKIFQEFSMFLREFKLNEILILGNTTISTAAGFQQIKVGNVEVGLRTYNLQPPSWKKKITK